jgi:hypothetical protein
MQPKPQFESCESLEAYLEALIEWLVDRRFEAIDREWLRQVGVNPE